MFPERKYRWQVHLLLSVLDQTSPSDTAEDVMEFGIVRNNVYQVTVTSIQGVGKDGVTEDIITDTETDDPTTVLLNVKLSIKPWVVRTNSAVLGR